MSTEPRGALVRILRVLALRFTREDFDARRFELLLAGLLTTWAVGIGRWWDAADAWPLQKLGLASLAYVFVLTALLAAFCAPLMPRREWRRHVFVATCASVYARALLVVVVSAAPGLLYAIPVERFMTMPAAQATNLVFLLVVASWRVSIWVVALRVVFGIQSGLRRLVATLAPISFVVVALVILRLHRGVFVLMAGMEDRPSRVQQAADKVLLSITIFSIVVLPLVLVAWLWMAISLRRAKEGA